MTPDPDDASGPLAEAAGSAPRARAGWAPFLEPGRRVVLRYAIARAEAPRGESMTDALGTIERVDASTVRVMTRRGSVDVPRALVIAAKEVPPPPRRRVGGAPG